MYWIPLLVILGLSIAAAFSPSTPLGLYGVSTCVFAGYHGFMFQGRLIKRELAGDAVSRISDLPLLFCSLMLGTAATVAGCIAFVATCVPAGMIAYNSVGASTNDFLIYFILAVCAGIAIFAAGWLIRWFLPRKPSNS